MWLMFYKVEILTGYFEDQICFMWLFLGYIMLKLMILLRFVINIHDKLMNIGRLPFGMAPCCQQTHLRIASRPEAQPIKPAGGFSVLLQPDKGHAFVLKAPCIDQPQSLRELRERRPQKSALSGAARSATGSAYSSSMLMVG